MDEDREERLAKNESLFRSIKEEIAALARRLGGREPYEFICECATQGCFERLTLTLEQYETVRKEGNRFLVAPGHEEIEIDQVVASRPNHSVVEKDGMAGIVALDDDPRT